MRFPYTLSAVRSAAASTFTNQFTRRLTICLLLSGFDGSVLAKVGPTVSEALKVAPWLAAAFVVLVAGLLTTLARTWFLAFRDLNPKEGIAVQPQPHAERRIP
jgi:hypothetical protein